MTIQRRLLASEKYLGLSPQSKVLVHLMHVHWRPDEPVGFGVREAEEKIPCSRKTAMRAFKELQGSGFIVMIEDSLFCSRTQSKARTWRLTWLPWHNKEPANNWEEKEDS